MNKLISVVSICWMLSLCILSGRNPSIQPNVLLVYVDDLRPALGAYGCQNIDTPNLDKFASEALVFESAYCQYSVCGPSRASTLSGLSPEKLGTFGNRNKLRAKVENFISLPQAFKLSGYTTYSIGKVFDPRMRDPGSWDQEFLYEPSALYINDENIEIHQNNVSKRQSDSSHKWMVGPPVEVGKNTVREYFDDRILREAKKALSGACKQKNPFFIAVGFTKPHLPFAAPSKFWAQYTKDCITLPEYNEIPKNLPEIAFWNWRELRAYDGVPQEGPVSEDLAIKLIHGYKACASYVDYNVGELLAELENQNQATNTIIVLLGDHGFHLGELGQWAKYINTDLATRVPLMIKVPGIKGRKINYPTELLDIYPTVCGLANIRFPADLDGKNLTTMLKGESIGFDLNRPVVSQLLRPGRAMGYSLKQGNLRYNCWINPKNFQLVAEELYSYKISGIEERNIILEPSAKITVNMMRSLMLSVAIQRNLETYLRYHELAKHE